MEEAVRPSPRWSGPEGSDPHSDGLPTCEFAWLGRVDYREAWDLQRALARQRAADEIPDTLLLLEHPPVFTTGRRGPGANLRFPAQTLGAPLIEVDRGGDITFHGPGQLIAYPIVDLRAAGLSVVAYVRKLEEVIIRTLAAYGVTGQAECGLTGVWVAGDKVAAIGVRVSRPLGVVGGWITSHGLALNIDVDLAWFERIVPCGIQDRGVTSLARLRGGAPGVEDAGRELAKRFGEVYGRRALEKTSLRPSQSPLSPSPATIQ